MEPLMGGGALATFGIDDRLRRAREVAGLEQAELAVMTRAQPCDDLGGRERAHEAP